MLNCATNCNKGISKFKNLAVKDLNLVERFTNKVSIPKSAETYNLTSVVSSNGSYEQYTFKNSKNEPIQRVVKYIDQEMKTKIVSTRIDSSGCVCNISRRTINDKNEIQDHKVSLVSLINTLDNTLLGFFKQFVTFTDKGDWGGLGFNFGRLKQRKPIGVNFDYNYNGEPARIKYKNNTFGVDLSEEERRYLPFVPRKSVLGQNENGQPIIVSQDFTDGRIQEKIGLAQIIQEKFHGIEGILPRAKGVKQEDLFLVRANNLKVDDLPFPVGGEALGNGQINISLDTQFGTDGVDILGRVAHEVQHEADYIKFYRGGSDATQEAYNRCGINESVYKNNNPVISKIESEAKAFQEKVIKKMGYLTKGTPEYNEAVDIGVGNFKQVAFKDLKSVQEHDLMDLELRANKRQIQETEKFQDVCNKLTNAILALIQS